MCCVFEIHLHSGFLQLMFSSLSVQLREQKACRENIKTESHVVTGGRRWDYKINFEISVIYCCIYRNW